jgi:hypothetical protein
VYNYVKGGTKMRLLFITIILVGLFSSILFSIAYSDSSNIVVKEGGFKISSAQQAVARALEYTGFGTIKDLSIEDVKKSAKLTTISDDKTPFLHEKINSKPIWRLVFADIPIKYSRTGTDSIHEHLRTFEVLIDPASGRLLKIHSIAEGYDTNISPLPPADVAEKQMRRIHELYHGFPERLPTISFLDAYKNNGLPLDKEIIAIYVLDSRMDPTPRSVWVIDRRGLPPRPTVRRGGNKHVSEYQRNHSRTIIDAETGDGLLFDNLPQAMSKPEDKKRIDEEKNNK